MKDLKASNLNFSTRFRVDFFENRQWFIICFDFFLYSRIVYFGFNESIRHIVELIQLLESNILGILPEALTAHIQVVLADQSMSVRTGTALTWALSVFPGPGVPHSFKTHVVYFFLNFFENRRSMVVYGFCLRLESILILKCVLWPLFIVLKKAWRL